MQGVQGSKFIFAILLLTVGISMVAPPTATGSEPGGAVKKASHPGASTSADQASKKSKEDRAIDLVWRRPDVKSWLKLFPKGKSKLGGHAAASVDHQQGDVYSVHVYEDLPDHTATFNWYDVNLKTGKITKMF
jgi:hypothetical protein